MQGLSHSVAVRFQVRGFRVLFCYRVSGLCVQSVSLHYSVKLGLSCPEPMGCKAFAAAPF